MPSYSYVLLMICFFITVMLHKQDYNIIPIHTVCIFDYIIFIFDFYIFQYLISTILPLSECQTSGVAVHNFLPFFSTLQVTVPSASGHSG